MAFASTLLRGCLVLVVPCLLALPGAVAIAQVQGPQAGSRPIRAASPDFQALLAMPLGVRPAEEMHWPQVLDRLGRPRDAQRLREWLLGLWLRQLAGETLPPPLALEQLLALPASQAVPTWDRQPQNLWQQQFNRHFMARLPAASVALPAEIEAVRDQLEPLGPGMWLRRDRAGTSRTFYAWIELVGRGPHAFPATGFVLPLADGVGLECELPRGQVRRLIAPGAAMGLLCARAVSTEAGTAAPALPMGTALADAAARASETGALQPDPLWREAVRRGLADALAEPRQRDRDDWLDKRQQAESDRIAAERAESDARFRAETQRNELKWRVALMAVGVFVVALFLWLARRFGPWRAAGVVWLVGMLVCVPLAWMVFESGRDNPGWGALGVLIVSAALLSAPTVAALFLAIWYTLITRFIGDANFRRELAMSMLSVTVLLLLQVLLKRLL